MRTFTLIALLAACDSPTLDRGSSEVTTTFDKLRELSATKTNDDSLPRGFGVLNGATIFFSATHHGLWRSDGTPQGTTLLRDLEPTLDSFNHVPHIVTLGTKAYWLQNSALWSSDGTPEGTTMVMSFGVEQMTAPHVYNGALYFGSSTQLYKSDGTAAGTQVLAAAKVYAFDDYFYEGFHEMGGKLYFPCDIGGSGNEPCVTDGTAAGTRVVKDLRSGNASSQPHFLGVLGNKLFFSGHDAVSLDLAGLYVTDGTSAGTIELVPPATNSDAIGTYEEDFAVLGTNAYIPCFTSATSFELCKTDGTVAGTSVIDIAPGTAAGGPDGLAVLGNRIYFTATNAAAGRELWSTDGTQAGTSLFVDVHPGTNDGTLYGQKVVMGGALYFLARSTFGSYEVWKTNGTAGGTAIVKDILPDGKPERYLITFGPVLAGKLVFTADDGVHGVEPWVTDGTQTSMLKDITPDANTAEANDVRVVANAGFFAVNDNTLWKSDGSAGGTGPFASMLASALNVVGTQLVFFSGNALWKTDGTAAPAKFKDLPGTVYESATTNGKLGFTGSTPNSAVGFYVSDGTTTTLTDIVNARRLGVSNGKFWLTGLASVDGNELWSSDGVTATFVKDIRPGGSSSEPSNFAPLGNLTIFAANDGNTGNELWKTDGTAANTQPLADIKPGTTGSGPFGMYAFKNMVLFWAQSATSYELWKTDGNTATMLKAIQYGGDFKFVTWGDHAFFAATDASGTELWRTDGTAAGTERVMDIYAGALSANPTNLVLASADGPLFFAAEEAKSGRELWRLDSENGTPALAADIAPGPKSSHPTFLAIAGKYLLAIADDGAGNAVYSAKVLPDDNPNGDGAPAGPDAGDEPTTGESGGCGCSSSKPIHAWPVLLVFVILRRRRR